MSEVVKEVSELTPHEVGIIGERLVANFIESNGYVIVERNWQCFAGEADLIAKDGAETVFIEIKTRVGKEEDENEIFPEEAVTKTKRTRYQNIIKAYCACHPLVDNVRFDVMGIILTSKRMAHLHHIKGIYLEDSK